MHSTEVLMKTATEETLAHQRLKSLREGLTGVMDKQYIAEWLQTPNPAFDNLKPIEVIERGEIDRIWRMIFYVESRMPA